MFKITLASMEMVNNTYLYLNEYSRCSQAWHVAGMTLVVRLESV